MTLNQLNLKIPCELIYLGMKPVDHGEVDPLTGDILYSYYHDFLLDELPLSYSTHEDYDYSFCHWSCGDDIEMDDFDLSLGFVIDDKAFEKQLQLATKMKINAKKTVYLPLEIALECFAHKTNNAITRAGKRIKHELNARAKSMSMLLSA